MTSRTRARRSSSSGLGLILAVAAVLVAAALFAVSGDPALPSTFDPDTAATPTITGDALAEDSVGDAAPLVRADALLGEGEQVLLADGQATMIVFLAHWCSHCNAEVPVVVDWLGAEALPDGVEVVAVATAIDPTLPNYPPDTWLRERDWVSPTLVDADGSIAAAYGVTGYPQWVFVDADGIVRGSAGRQTAEQLSLIAAELADL
jgi:thiol-disulfide isomerase/thioredoxin